MDSDKYNLSRFLEPQERSYSTALQELQEGRKRSHWMWNMFNARAFATGRSAFHFKGCGGFALIALVILVGQILIVEFGGQFFNVEPLKFMDWVIIICGTSVVLWIGELIRLFKK